MYKLFEDENKKVINSENYNSALDKNTGKFIRFGATFEEDPEYCEFGAEILDLEISQGKCMGNCAFCYKENGAVEESHNMTFEQFKNVFHKVAGTTLAQDDKGVFSYINTSPLGQIAFGICDIGSNPEFFDMMAYSKANGVIPNYTCHGLDMNEEYAKKTAELCGAVAVSVYNKEKSYNAIKMLTDAGMKQVNIHFVLAEQTYDKAFEIMNDIKTDERLKGLKAIVFLSYKAKGAGVGKFNSVTNEQFKSIIDYATENRIGIGFDSCGCHKYLNSIKDDADYEQKAQYAEPCESSCFSSYINCKGEFFACSFCEGEGMWKEGINVLEAKDFMNEVWNADKTKQFRELLLKNGRKCPMFKID